MTLSKHPPFVRQTVRQMLLVLVLAVLAPILLVLASIYYVWYHTEVAERKSDYLDLAQTAALAFGSYVRDVQRQELGLGVALVALKPHSSEQADRLLATSQVEYMAARAFHWVDPAGTVIASNDPKSIGSKIAGEPYFKDLLAGRDVLITELLVSKDTGEMTFVIARRIVDESRKFQGVVAAVINPLRLGEQPMRLRNPTKGSITLFDRRGALVYSSTPGDVSQRSWSDGDPFLREALAGREAAGQLVSPTGSGMDVVTRVPVTDTGWVAGTSIPLAEITRPVLRNLLAVAAVALGVIGISLLAAVLVGRRIDTRLLRLAAIVESSDDAIISKTLDGTIVSWNQGAQKMWGYSADEAIGKSISILTPSDRPDDTLSLLEETRHGETVEQYETVRVRKDGTRVDVSLTVSPTRDASGKITGASTIARDITRRKQMEEAVRSASLYTRSLIEASLDPLVTISPRGKITDVNHATELATGLPREQLIGSDFSDYFTEPEKARQGYRKVISDGLVKDYPLTIRHASGRTVDVLYDATVYRNEAGEMTGVFAAARDVTERKKAEEELDRYRRHLEEMVKQRTSELETVNRQLQAEVAERKRAAEQIEHLARFPSENPSPVLRIAKDGTLLYGNPASQSLLDEWGCAVGQTAPDTWVKLVRDAFASAERQETEITHRDRTFTFVVTPRTDAGYVNVYGLDITRRKHAEEALRQSEQRLNRAQEIAHLGSWELDLASNRLTWSDEVYRIFGIQPQAFGATYEAFLEAVHPDDRAAVDAAYSTSLREGRDTYEIEHRIVRKPTGELRTVHEKCEHFRDDSGRIIRSVGMVLDITERKRAELALKKSRDELETRVRERTAELRKTVGTLESEVMERRRAEDALKTSEARYRTLIEEAVEGVILADKTGVLLEVNPALCWMLGYEPPELLGHNIAEFVSTEELHRKPLPLDDVAAGKTVVQQRQVRRKDGTVITVEGSAKLLVDGRVLLVCRDISRRKEAQEKLRRYQTRLKSMATELSLVEERQRRQIARDLHDRIGQTLAAAKVKLALLRANLPYETSSFDEVLHLVTQAIEDTRSLTFELVPPILHDLGLEPALEWLVEQFRTRHGIAAEFDSDGGLHPLDENSRTILFRSVRELLINVVKHSHAKNVKLTLQRTGDDIRLSVQDDGVGFDSSRLRPGLQPEGGFGLFSVREQLGYLGGHFHVESVPGRGTHATLTVHLKRAKKKSRGEPHEHKSHRRR